MSKPIVIIGAGVSGLAAAGYLAGQGKPVVVFEANNKVGGSCANTVIDGYSFNDGAMYLVMPTLLDRVFAAMGAERAALVPLRQIEANSTTILPDETTVTIHTRKGLKFCQPGSVQPYEPGHQDIERLLLRWGDVYDLFEEEMLTHPFSMGHFLSKGWKYLMQLRGTVASELNRTVQNKALRAALSGALLYTGLPPEKMSIFSILGLIAMLRDGFFLPEGGMGAIPQAMARVVTQNGGKIHLNAPVQEIIVREGRVVGVNVSGHGEIETDCVLATTSGMITFGRLISTEVVPESLQRKVKRSPLSHTAISIQLGLKHRIDAPSHSVNVIPYMDQQHLIFDAVQDQARWLAYSVPTVTHPELSPENTDIIETYIPVQSTYQADQIVQNTLDFLARKHNAQVAVKRVRTPKEFASQLNLYQGALYGLSPGAGFMSYFDYRSPIKGLWQAGQTTYPGMGVVTSAMSGVLAAQQINM